MSGWFRTGKIFAIEHWDVLPDIMTTAKGASAAYTPVAITAVDGQLVPQPLTGSTGGIDLVIPAPGEVWRQPRSSWTA